MSSLRIEFEGARRAFNPGEVLSGRVSWQEIAPEAALEVRLFWYTRGKGDRDLAVVNTFPLSAGSGCGQSAFSFTLPAEPLSFSGKLISLIWAVEFTTARGEPAERVEFIVSPSGQEILL